MKAKTKVCNEILEIAAAYHEFTKTGHTLIEVPAGLRTTRDFWDLILKWEQIIKTNRATPVLSVLSTSPVDLHSGLPSERRT